MHRLVLICLAAASAFAQGGKFGAFTDSADIGAPPMKGAAEFDAAAGQYRITGTGTDIWGKADQFHYVWREMSGNFAVTATTRFVTEGNDHRKAAIMLRQSTDADSPYCDLVIHGNGMPGVQFRNAKGENTNTVDFPIEGPGTFKLKLVRQGATITVFAAKEGAPLRELGHTSSQLGSPVLVGLGVSSHSQTALNTVVFSDVSVEQSAPPASRSFGAFTNAGDVGNPAKKGSTVFDPATGEYRITGSGANIWAKEDQFQYVWREMSGNFVVTATMRFLGKGADHRKAGIMLRQSLDTDSAYGDIVIHGNGMPGIQWRSNKGENTNAFDLPFDSPGKFKLKLVRNGVGLTVSIAKDGAPLQDVARTEVSLRNPILVGLAICSHDPNASDTVVFSDVSLEPLAAPAAKKQ
jgi:regulation of enolase protein 1 (concanavalin A-like superfamily)